MTTAATKSPDVMDVTIELMRRGVFLGQDFQVGRHCPAIPDGNEWEVCTKAGVVLVLSNDVVQAAGWFLRISSGETVIDLEYAPRELLSGEDHARNKRIDVLEQLERAGYLPPSGPYGPGTEPWR